MLALAFTVAVSGCGKSSSSRSELLPRIDRDLLMGGRLCTGPLALPDRTPQKAIRRQFENTLVRLRVFQRDGDTFSVSPSHAGDILILKKGTRTRPGVGAVCFGTIHATQVVASTIASNGEDTIEFAFHIHLTPWAQPLRSYLHLPPDGTARGAVLHGDAPYNPWIVWRPGYTGLNFYFTLWPPNGTNWYPDGLPPSLQWHDLRHIKV